MQFMSCCDTRAGVLLVSQPNWLSQRLRAVSQLYTHALCTVFFTAVCARVRARLQRQPPQCSAIAANQHSDWQHCYELCPV